MRVNLFFYICGTHPFFASRVVCAALDERRWVCFDALLRSGFQKTRAGRQNRSGAIRMGITDQNRMGRLISPRGIPRHSQLGGQIIRGISQATDSAGDGFPGNRRELEAANTPVRLPGNADKRPRQPGNSPANPFPGNSFPGAHHGKFPKFRGNFGRRPEFRGWGVFRR